MIFVIAILVLNDSSLCVDCFYFPIDYTISISSVQVVHWGPGTKVVLDFDPAQKEVSN